MSDECKTQEACSDEPTQFIHTGRIIFDGTAFTCEFDSEFEVAVGDKMNDLLALLFTQICTLKNTVGTAVDSFITDVTLNGSSLDFTANGTAFSGSIDLSSLVGTNDIDYVNNVSFAGTTLTFAGTGNAFAGGIDLVDIDGRFTGISFDGTTLTFTGVNSQANLDIDISSVNTDTNDIDYINGSNLVGSTLNLTGVGNAGTSVSLQPIIDAAVAASGGGSNDDDRISRFETVTFNANNSGVITAWTNGASGSKIQKWKITQWLDDGTPDPTDYIDFTVFGNPYRYTRADFDAGDKDLLEFIDAPLDENGYRFLTAGNGLTITAETPGSNESVVNGIIINTIGFDF